MTHRQFARMQQGEHARRKLEQAERIGNGGAVATHCVRYVLLRQAELRDEPVVPARLVHRRQVVALQVLDQRERQDGAVVHLALDRGNLLPAEGLTRAHPALAGD